MTYLDPRGRSEIAAPQPQSVIPGPLVSFVMPCYRESAAVLDRALDSVLGQTYQNLEIIAVLDDPENDTLLKVLTTRAARDHRLRVLVNERNLGVWPSYDRGVREAHGEFIAIQDADDASLPQRVERLVAHLTRDPDVGVVGSGLSYVNEESGAILMDRVYPPDARDGIKRYSPLAHATTVCRAALHTQVGTYDLSPWVMHAADYELWCRWSVSGVRMESVPEVLYMYYQSDSNFKARNVKAILRDTVAVKRAYAEELGFGFLDRLWLWLETASLVFPSRVIVRAFYAVNRRRSRAWRRSSRL